MTQNLTPDQTRHAVLTTLAREVGELSKRIASALDASPTNRGRPATVETPPERHPLETAILAILADAKSAVRKTEIAKRLNVERSSVHYHCKRLVLRNEIYSIETVENGRDVDYVILTNLLQIPGLRGAKA